MKAESVLSILEAFAQAGLADRRGIFCFTDLGRAAVVRV